MDGFKEKKWFVYLGDHHEGPFSLEDIQTKMSQGQLSATNYVWAENMADWKVMTEVEAFGSILNTASAPPSAPTQSLFLDLVEPSLISVQEKQAAPVTATSNSNPKFPLKEKAKEHSSVEIRLEASPRNHARQSPSAFDESKLRKRRSRGGALKRFVFLVVVLGAGFAYFEGYLDPLMHSPRVRPGIEAMNNFVDPLLIKLGDEFPILSLWISPIPQLPDVDKEELESMKTAAKAKLDVDGPQLGAALSKADLLNPTFYVSSNLPDGAQFDVYVEGISETLLNQLSFFGKNRVVISKRFGQTGETKGIDGKPFPRGQYMVYFVDPGNQSPEVSAVMSRFASVNPQIASVSVPKGAKIIAAKSYFLGGQKDSTYTARLKEFHDKLAAKAQAELSECKQFAATLDMQLASTISKFISVHRGKKVTPGQKSAWASFDKQWSLLLAQITRSFAQFTPEILKNDYFYGNLYLASQRASQAVSDLHVLQTGLFNGSVNAKSFEIQMGESVSVARDSVNELKAKIEFIEKLPPKPNGMPNRDGM
jgi:hypothetical protein